MRFEPGDEILVTDHGYNACANAARFVAERHGLRVVVAHFPFPVTDPRQVTDAVRAAVSARTRLALLDHVTSPTGLILPIEGLVRALAERGVDTLVDGAHAPGMLPLALDALGAAYNRELPQVDVHAQGLGLSPRAQGPPSRGAPSRDQPRSQLSPHGPGPLPASCLILTGTQDPTAWLVIPEAMRFMGSLLPGGWDELRAHNRALVLRGRAILCDALGIAPPAPEACSGRWLPYPFLQVSRLRPRP